MDRKTTRMRVVPAEYAAWCRPEGLRRAGALTRLVNQRREDTQHEAASKFIVVAEVDQPLRLQPVEDGSLVRLGHPNPVRDASAGVIDRVACDVPCPSVLHIVERRQ